MTGPAPHFERAGPTKWKNWHQSVEQKVADLVTLFNADSHQTTIPFYNAMTGVLQSWIGTALAGGLELRALGGGWSISPAAATSGILLDTRPLNYRIEVGAPQLDASCTIAPENLVLAQCGMTIAELSDFLLAKGKSLKTSGASNGQTIAGAIATGTHGSGLDIGAIQDGVRGLHLVRAPDQHVWLERASEPVLSANTIAQLGATLLRDDAVFEAGLVGLGSCGLVHGVLLEVEDLFQLWTMRKKVPLDAPLRAAIEQLDFSGLTLGRPGVRPHHFQIIANPRDPGNAYVTLMYKSKDAAPDCKPVPPASKLRQGDSALEVIGILTDLLPGASGPIGGLVLAHALPDFEGVCGTHAEIFGDTTTRGKSAGSALGVPLAQAGVAFDQAVAIARQGNFAGLVALRYVQASRATLAFTHHQPHTCIVDLDGPQSANTRSVFRKVWQAYEDLGIPFTFHWGKIHELTNARLVAGYGQSRIDAWKSARAQLLPTPALRKVFSNDFLRAAGLAD